MTINNDAPVNGLSDADGNPLTRGGLVDLITTDLRLIGEGVQQALTEWQAGNLTPPQARAAAIGLAQHLAGYSQAAMAALVEHDTAQMYAAPMPDAITIPDHLPEDFA